MKKFILLCILIFSYSAFSYEGLGDVIFPDKYNKPKELDFTKWSNDKKKISEKYFIPRGSVNCGSRNGLKYTYNKLIDGYVTKKELLNKNCATIKRPSFGRIIKTEGLFSFVEFSNYRKDSEGYYYHWLNWLITSKLEPYNEHEDRKAK